MSPNIRSYPVFIESAKQPNSSRNCCSKHLRPGLVLDHLQPIPVAPAFLPMVIKPVCVSLRMDGATCSVDQFRILQPLKSLSAILFNRMVAGTRDIVELKIERYAAAARWRGAASVAMARCGTSASVPRRSHVLLHTLHAAQPRRLRRMASDGPPAAVPVFACPSVSPAGLPRLCFRMSALWPSRPTQSAHDKP